MKTLFLLACVVLLAGCNEPNAPVQVDAPQLAYSLRWVGVCAVLCSTIGGIALIIATNNRRK